MQISNREQDWIIDTLALRDDLTVLNEVFADPNIVKVFHGAFMDIYGCKEIWGYMLFHYLTLFMLQEHLDFQDSPWHIY